MTSPAHQYPTTRHSTVLLVVFSMVMGAIIGGAAAVIANPPEPVVPPGADLDGFDLWLPLNVAFVAGAIVGGLNGLLVSPFIVAGFGRARLVPGLALIFVPALLTAGIAAFYSGALAAYFASSVCYVAMAGIVVRFAGPPAAPPGECRQCGYDMSGLQSALCPECGCSTRDDVQE